MVVYKATCTISIAVPYPHNNPSQGSLLTYFEMHVTVFQWSMLGSYISGLNKPMANERSGLGIVMILE